MAKICSMENKRHVSWFFYSRIGVNGLKTIVFFIWTVCLFGTANAGVLTVLGTAQIEAAPDRVVLNIGVSVVDAEASKAMSAMKDQASYVIEMLETLVAEKSDIATQHLAIQPDTRYDPTTQQNVHLGYRAETTIRAMLGTIDSLADALDQFTERGIGTINSLSFIVSDPETYHKQARHLAIQNAMQSATEIAQSAGVSLGEILSISAPDARIQPRFETVMEMSVAARSAPIAVGTVMIREEIQMTYDLK